TKAGDAAKTGDIADALGVSPPSVTEMLSNLEERGLIEYEKYEGATLTSEGEEIASDVLQKHCLIERFLVKYLNVEEGFHEEACRIEHVMSDDVASQLGDIVSQEPDCPSCYDPASQHCALLFSSN
ncbi:MAG: metal-dependent transcriptional regulator, partial [Halobacteria archaeon]|nr:metal-dependent transcriptional regulator [Halobacteria archaeon]